MLYLNPLRFQPDAVLNLHFPMEDAQILAVKAVLGQTGFVQGVDYRGVAVIGAVEPVPGSPWFLVARMDISEVYASLTARLWQTVLFFGVLILAAGAGLAVVWRQQRVHYYRAQVEKAEALRNSEIRYSGELEGMVEQRTRELRETQEKLVRQERLATLGQVAGSIGHELRNPLGVISNAIYFLKMAQPDAGATIKEYLDIIENETRASDKFITELLDFTRIKAVKREPVLVSELVRQTLERYPAPPSVEVALQITPNLPPVYADSQHIVQVLGNLAVNACQAMSDGGKLVLSALAQGNMISIAVQDTGMGIPPENMVKIFEPLFTTKIKGIGLGLSVSQKLAEANGGRIEAQSQRGKGSTFTLYLPVYEVVPVPARDKEEK